MNCGPVRDFIYRDNRRMLRRSDATILRRNAPIQKLEEEEGQLQKIEALLKAIQEVKTDLQEIKEILQEVCTEDSECDSREEVARSEECDSDSDN